MSQLIYMVHLREFKKTKENIYKIGRTERSFKDRMCGYPKGSTTIVVAEVKDCRNAEREIMKTFDHKFTQRNDIGREYYEGNVDDMLNEFNKIVKLFRVNDTADCKIHNDDSDSSENKYIESNNIITNIPKNKNNKCYSKHINKNRK